MQFFSDLKARYQQQPLLYIMLVAGFFRILAGFFSKGYAFHDEHFCVITPAQSWIYGERMWLDWPLPPKHSISYASLHYITMQFLEKIGLGWPEFEMTVVRLLHGLYSLLTVWLGYKLAMQLGSKKAAVLAGWILAVLWFLPYLSVKSLVELVCVPPLLAGFYWLNKKEEVGFKDALLAGLLFGVAVSVRYHSIMLIAGLGVVWLYNKNFPAIAGLLAGGLLSTLLLVGLPDLLYFGWPFASVVEYFSYNSTNANNFTTGPVYRFVFTVLGFLVPPISLLLVWGSWYMRKKATAICIGMLLFFVVHSLFPNKQERFILPLLPFIVVVGAAGWQQLKLQDNWFARHPGFMRFSWRLFWSLNVVVSLALALTYSKKSRVEPMQVLGKLPNWETALIETHRYQPNFPPLYYLNQPAFFTNSLKDDALEPEEVKAMMQRKKIILALGNEKPLDDLKYEMQTLQTKPNYVVVQGRKELETRMVRLRLLLGEMTAVATIEPALYDRLLHFLNPRHHSDEFTTIYRVK